MKIGLSRQPKWISVALTLLTMMISLSSPLASAQFLEEAVTLESLYESRARAVLNTLLRPNEYSLVVSADLDRDEKRLEAFREDLETQFLPGLPFPPSADLVPGKDRLHKLKNRIELHLVLSNTVPPDKEGVIKSILTSKLHLDSDAGDIITVQRTSLPIEEVSPPSLLPDFSWKTWTLILILGMLGLAGIVFWASRREKKHENRQVFEMNPMDRPIEELAASTSAASTPDSQDATASAKALSDAEMEDNIVKIKEQVLSLVIQYPTLSSRAITEHMAAGNEKQVTLFFERLGWESVRPLFREISTSSWRKVGIVVKDRTERPTLSEYHEAMDHCYRLLLAAVLEVEEGKDEVNPFAFVFRLPPVERESILHSESVTNLAIIALHCNPDQLSELFGRLPIEKQNELALATAQMEKLPESAVKATTNSLLTKLKSYKDKAEVPTSGHVVAAELLRALPPEREQEIFGRILAENPDQAHRIRRVHVQFLDLPLLPSNLVGQVLDQFELEALTTALFQAPPDLVQHLLSLLPIKKANMIQSDLRAGVIHPTKSETARVRREIAQRAEALITSEGLDLKEIWDQMESDSYRDSEPKSA